MFKFKGLNIPFQRHKNKKRENASLFSISTNQIMLGIRKLARKVTVVG